MQSQTSVFLLWTKAETFCSGLRNEKMFLNHSWGPLLSKLLLYYFLFSSDSDFFFLTLKVNTDKFMDFILKNWNNDASVWNKCAERPEKREREWYLSTESNKSTKRRILEKQTVAHVTERQSIPQAAAQTHVFKTCSRNKTWTRSVHCASSTSYSVHTCFTNETISL